MFALVHFGARPLCELVLLQLRGGCLGGRCRELVLQCRVAVLASELSWLSPEPCPTPLPPGSCCLNRRGADLKLRAGWGRLLLKNRFFAGVLGRPCQKRALVEVGALPSDVLPCITSGWLWAASV